MSTIACVVLAAGKSTRMKSALPKVLHELAGKPLIGYTLDLVKALGIRNTVFVTGYQAGLVERYLRGYRCVRQTALRGTADAVKRTAGLFRGTRGTVLVLCADTPLLTAATLRRLIARHTRERNVCTILTAQVADPAQYGRIVRGPDGKVRAIVEEINATAAQKTIGEINTGVYCFSIGPLFEALGRVRPDERKREFFLTDVIELFCRRQAALGSCLTQDTDEFLGINSRAQLAHAWRVLFSRNARRLMGRGVTIVDPAATYIHDDVRVGTDTVIYPQTVIERGARIGRRCVLGPFCRIREGVRLADEVEIGNFVEVVRSSVGRRSKAKHLTYLGDARIGSGVNIGAGTITANYDGKGKHTTVIKDRAFIGSGTICVAPVRIGTAAVTGSGAVVTKRKNVPAHAVVVGVPARELKKKNRAG